MRLQDKVTMVTGGGSGIGRGIARMFAREGARVFVTDWESIGGQETAAQIQAEGGESAFEKGDISHPEDVDRVVRAVIDRWGGLNVLVNNAGIIRLGTATETSIEDWDQVMSINLRGAFLCARAAIPLMAAGGGGAIINIASIGGLRGSRGLAAYQRRRPDSSISPVSWRSTTGGPAFA